MNTGQSAKQAEHGPAPKMADDPDAGVWAEASVAGESQPGHEAAPPNVREVFVKRALILAGAAAVLSMSAGTWRWRRR